MIFRPLFCLGVWGRKDAFPGADGSTIPPSENTGALSIKLYDADGRELMENTPNGLRLMDITTAGIIQNNTSLIYSVKYPLDYIYSTTEPYDWYTQEPKNQNNNLWGEEAKKGIYDPCPSGWRIAQQGLWEDFQALAPYYIQGTQTSTGNKYATNGRLYNHMTWISTAGYRHFRTGILSYIGYSGYFWFIQVSNELSICMSFNTSGVNPQGEHNRATGMSVRCIQE